MNSVYSGKKLSVYSGEKWIVLTMGRHEYCLFREEMNDVYSGNKWIVLIQGRNE
jgi:hypothetical protein